MPHTPDTPDAPTLYDVDGELLPRPFKTGRLGHFGLYVRDIPASLAFYQDVLGFRRTDALPGPEGSAPPYGVFLTYNADHHAMVVIDAEVGKARGDAYAQGVTINQMSFQVATLREVVEANAMLTRRAKPVRRVGRDVPGSNWAVYFTDPDRNTVELFYGMEQIGWDRRSKPPEFIEYRSAEPPRLPQPAELDEVRAVQDTGTDIGSGHQWSETREAVFDVGGVLLPRPFKIVNSGPISLFVSDIEASIAFYVDEMGMAVTEETTYAGERVVYLRSGTEHHTITLLPLALRRTVGLDQFSTLAAYGLQVGSYRQLRDAAAFLEAEGCAIVELPRELHLGIDYALHVTDPDGHTVQIYHQMEQVGTLGRPMTAAERRRPAAAWPRTLTPLGPTSPNPTFQGPLG
ncbi:VOC family protein [Streptomyces sp. NPDC026665]|uniref:VOC family protein n=1 Tax=Streptomyces sp. NPDC026665 TaxID=3154798 RepID=UPI0033F414FA